MRWIFGIIGLLAANALAMIVLAITANSGHSQIIPAYYERAAHYDNALDAAAASKQLGWHASATLDGNGLTVDLRDRTGAPVLGAHVRVTGYQRAHASDAFATELAQTEMVYRAPLRTRAGLHDLHVTVERGASRFVADLAVEAR